MDSPSSKTRGKRRSSIRTTTPLPVLADDSGLRGFCAGRQAGHYSHDTRAQKPLTPTGSKNSCGAGRCRGDRSARFVCALALARGNRILIETEGECARYRPGPARTKGFGYDPIFLFPELVRTYAELDEEEKNRYSHRGHAVRKLLEALI